MKIAVILGTRPEIIKMAPVIRELEKGREDYFIIHTGQHYSYHLDGVFFDQLKLPRAKYNLDIGSCSHAEQTGKMLMGLEKVLKAEKPDVALVEGDTNTVLAGALAAAKLQIRLGHVEAGLRSYDRNMPEEINRVLADHCSDYLFAPTEKAKQTLLGEGIVPGKVFVTGNTIVDAVYQSRTIAGGDSVDAIVRLGLEPGEYFLLTIHRQENVDSRKRFTSILEGLKWAADEFKIPVIYPIHPRSKRRMDEFGLKPDRIKLVEPIDFLNLLQLEGNARLVLTDSGGMQEESCILGVPCVTLRDNTERPETVDIGANILAGTSPERILECVKLMCGRKNGWQQPFGDGKAGERIVKIVMAG